MIDTNRVPRFYRVTEMKELFHLPPLGRGRSWHETRLGLTRLCRATFEQLLTFGATFINLQQFRFTEHFLGKI